MVARRTVDLLPEIFRTDTNRKFLSATLDQITQEPSVKRTQGFVGRRVGPGVDPADRYVTEPDATRTDYQLEPGVVFFQPDTNRTLDAITYPGMVDALDLQGANVQRQDRLWQSEYYTWDPFCDLDKFSNYSQYYWLPNGPDSVDVSTAAVPLTDAWEVTRVSTGGVSAYQFSDVAGNNPTLTLVRGGNYTFDINQPGSRFWIQAAPGVDGRLPASPNISSRDVLGVENNGIDNGIVTFNVPLRDAQQFFYDLTDLGFVDLITDLRFDQINNVYVDQFLSTYRQGIDGITNLDGLTLVFTNSIVNPQDGGWQVTTQFDPLSKTTFAVSGSAVNSSYKKFTNVNLTTVTGSGAGASATVVIRAGSTVYSSGTTQVLLENVGSGYAVGDTLRITGTALGGSSPLNDMTLTVLSVSQNGLLGSFDTTLFDQTTDIPFDTRYSIWQVQYINDTTGRPYIRLNSIEPVALLSKFTIRFGNRWSNTQWYKDASGFYEKIPLLTAVLDTLWYQDSQNPEIFGRLRLIDSSENQTIDINDIIGAKNYTSPNGVVFTNGLKVQFRGLVEPAEYQDREYYVEGVGTGPGTDARVGFVDGEAYFGASHVYQGVRYTGAARDTSVFQQIVYDDIADSLANLGVGAPAGAPLPRTGTPGAADGNGIRLLPVEDFVTPEAYITEETAILGDDGSSLFENQPRVPDYITINRASRDRNAWTRSNRWFHVDVIQATADYNNQIAVLDNDFRAKRPIIEFRANMDLFNFGTQAKVPVNMVDLQTTDALSLINGQQGYSVDGYTFTEGSLVIFAADLDPLVRNRIYRVTFIDPDESGTDIINLVEIDNGQAFENQTVVCLDGNTLKGVSFWFDGAAWIQGQQKTGVNRSPLFDVYDVDGRSFGNRQFYPSTTFTGSRLFGYAQGGTQIIDEVLGFSLKFLNINNVGDIVFENYFYTDTFIYVEGSVSSQKSISDGYVRQYIDRTAFTSLIGWLPAAGENRSRQVFRFVYDGEPLVLDVPVDQQDVFPALQVFIGTNFIDPDQYSVTVIADTTVVVLTDPPELGTVIEVQALSDVASAVAFYQVPLNLENNPLNENSPSFTLGTIRRHYDTIGQNLKEISGPINGANNSRDLGNILVYGTNIIQNSSPLTLAGVFLRQQQYELFDSIRFNSQEYEKFKARMIYLAAQGDFINNTPTQILDSVILEMGLGRTDQSSFYWSDMLPAGSEYTETNYTFTVISTNVFGTIQTYDFTASNFLGLLVYVNGVLLTKDYDYTVGVDSPTVTITRSLAIGDRIAIREWSATYGTYVPNTPTKMGLYPAFRPEMYLDTGYVTPTMVIRGHDGSITVAYGDFRDQVLLEFETRIFDNLKIQTPVPITAAEVIPGQFRTTDYSLAEINTMLAQDFLSWIGWNKLDYITQTYIAGNEFTYNYSQSGNRLDRQPLLGAWRGIYNFFYDTDAPTTRPWEMLGFSEQPDWWTDYYGPAPYTSGNQVLWEDLAEGLVNDPQGAYVLPRYRRPGLLDVIPAGSEGELLSPLEAVVGNFDPTSFRRSWVFGDDGPVENVWRTSSAYPFAVMRLLALTRPGKFFSLFADRDRYVFSAEFDQYLWDGRYRLDAKQIDPIYGDGVSKASYINWIVDYRRQTGINTTTRLTNDLANVGVRLCWRLGAFTDKKYLKIYTERSTPNSLNTSLLLPDESYQLLLYKNQPFEEVTYSSVIVQTTDDGWAVFGYGAARPYFNILTSLVNGNFVTIEAGGSTARVALDHTDNVAQVPYGFVFRSRTAVCDFLYSYGKLLESQGLTFESRENGYTLNWLQMAQEFLYWSNQGWTTGSIINLNPGATKITVSRPQAVVDSIANLTPENLILNQNRQPLPAEELVINRIGNEFSLISLTSNTINFCNLRFTAYEHMVVLDNVSIFADLIYEPVTGARQSRVLVSGTLSADWTGLVNAPGFVLNQDNIAEWVPNVKYAKGTIVLFKNEYWAASEIIQPAQQFDYSLWIKTDYDEIQTGLLPNAANASDQLATAYSIFDANLETEVDLFSYGLIGFRPREYMQALNLDDVSQVGLYQQFLGTKGTRRSLELFSLADLGKEVAEYNIYEYWAMLQGQYGANGNRNYYELRLNEARLRSDPSLVQVIQPGETSEADQTVLLQNVWKTSTPLSSPNILPTTLVPATQGFPSAGYVNLEDVDLTVFSLEDLNQARQEINANLAAIGVGTLIWVARTNAFNWNVYRTQLIRGDVVAISDNLDGTSLVTFAANHGLVPNDFIIIKLFDPAIDGFYQVRTVPTLTTITIDFSFTGTQTQATGEGIAFTLLSARVAQPADILGLSYSTELQPGAKIWVDNDGSGRWAMLEKTDQFQFFTQLSADSLYEYSRYGASIAQGLRNLSAMIGAPGYFPPDRAFTVYSNAVTYAQGDWVIYNGIYYQSLQDSNLANLPTDTAYWSAGSPGSVYTYIKNETGQYAFNVIRSLGSLATAGYGNAMDSGDQTWAVVGASLSLNGRGYAAVIFNPPTSNAFAQWQMFVGAVDDEFGYSVTVSQDERWIYVGAPGNNRVYAYGRVDVQSQSVQYRTNGTQFIFNYDQSIVIDSGQSAQLIVVLDNEIQVLGSDYTVTGTSVVFAAVPPAGLLLQILRRTEILDQGDGAEDTFSVLSLYAADDIYAIAVYLDDVLQRPVLDYALVGSDIVFTTPPALFVNIRIRASSHYSLVSTITVGGLSASDRFGHSVSTTTDGRFLVVGTPDRDSESGRVYVFDRSVQRFQVTDANELTYTTEQTPVAPTAVLLNGQFLTDTQGNVDGTFTVTGNDITLDTTIAVGDIIEVETNTFQLVQTIESQRPFEGAKFGWAVDQCVNDCSIYIGAPFDGTTLPDAGQVEFWQNQSRVYGITESTVANATLTPGDFLRVNNYFIEVPTVDIWSGSSEWPSGAFVTTPDGAIYQALRAVPAGVAITDDTYWRPSGWAARMAQAINDAAVPNAQAQATSDVDFLGDFVTRTFDIGTTYSAASSYTAVVFVNNVLQTSGYTYDNATGIITFAVAPVSGARITVISGRVTVSVINLAASTPLDRLKILPGTGTVFADMGWTTVVGLQIIESPVPQAYSNFGQSLFISEDTVTLAVGAPRASMIGQDTFDGGSTTFDSTSTQFVDEILESGVVYIYDNLPAANTSVSNPSQFVFGQQIYRSTVESGSQFGTAVDYTTGVLLISAPGADLGDSAVDYGTVYEYTNPSQAPAWQIRRRQTPVVDITLMNTVFMYDRISSAAKQYFDFFDPLQGRLLGAVQQNIDYIGAVDPAAYNVGVLNNYGNRWGQDRVGQIWWDIANARFIDPNQDDIVYASRRWGQLFPGSQVEVYQWISSSVPPAQYAGEGSPRSVASYSIVSSLNEQGIFGTTYYFWVTGIRTVDRAARKTLGIDTITRYIESPRSSGISYIAPINASTTAIYNGLEYIVAEDTVLHIEYEQEFTEQPVNVQYQLIAQDRPQDFLSDTLYRKLQDSFCGVDTVGNLVPDPFLPESDRYGVAFRPRQSMFVNRFLALQNYLQQANAVMAQYPVAENRRLALLNSADPEPNTASGAWDKRLANYDELTYQDLAEVPYGYRYLVSSDSTNNGLWTIYEVIPGLLFGSRELRLIRVQNYDTRLYWQYIDWYLPGYNPLTVIAAEVPNYSALATITVPEGSSVKVTANAQGKFEIYRLETGQWIRVALEDGTVAISPEIWDYSIGRFGFDIEVFDAQYFDQEPVVETRKIIQAINEEIFIGELAIERNRLLTLTFNYILSEQIAPEWLTKTSLIDVDHVIRKLEPFQIYRQDNQDFVLDYIQEVKPYHVQIREFSLIYQGSDTYLGTMTDFDVPAYWNTLQQRFISPVLDDPNNPLSTTSSTPADSPIWQTLPWNQWYQNYLLSIESVSVADGGSGYTVAPQVVVTGDSVRPAVMTARVNSLGQVSAIDVIDPGEGYLTTAILTLEGGNGTGARAVAVMGNQLVRDITTTIKYDRYQYQSTVQPWQANQTYSAGTLVRYDDRVWQADSTVTNAAFDPDQWTLVPAGDLSGVDRTMGYYVPTVNQPGLDLALLISGVDYPGVQVSAPDFNQDTGFDVGNYDINPFDNIAFGPEGRPTYDPAILDAIYESEFTDPYLGTLPAPAYQGDPPTGGPNPIIVDGGAFVDTYSSHAPEELVPGAIFDTLDFRVFTTPGSDWSVDGHGFPIKAVKYTVASGSTYSYAGLLDTVTEIMVWNQTTGLQLIVGVNYTVDWVSQTISLLQGANNGDIIVINAYGLGGGNQLYINSFLGTDIGNTATIPVQFSLVAELVVFVNGVQITNFTAAAFQTFSTRIVFATTWGATDTVTIAALGEAAAGPTRSWSTPITQYFVATGSLSFVLTNSLQGTNPANLVVERNGERARPPEGVEYIADGSSLQYYLPNRGGYSLGLVTDSDVSVYIDNVAQTLNVDFIVDAWDGSNNRTITLLELPDAGSQIIISVSTGSVYTVTGNTLAFKPSGGFIPLVGDVISVTSFNDTSEQNILTQIFVGPETVGAQVAEGYDTTDFDQATVSFTAGSYDFATGIVIQTNRFDTGRLITNASRLEVSIDGEYLFEGAGFVIDGSVIEILGPPISSIAVVAITSFTQSVVPGVIAFRIFQDMRGLQSTYRIIDTASTTLAQPLTATQDVIYVEDASRLSEPNLPQGIFGLVTINGERISYRVRNTDNNTISGLRRGTAGTGADSHVSGSAVYDIGIGELLPAEYQDRVVADNTLADGSQTVFVAPNIMLDTEDSTELVEAVQVYVGGTLQTSGYTVTGLGPVTIVFATAPTAGYQVSIRVRRGLSWYEPGPGTASDGIPLQEQQTQAARFIRGG